MTGRAELHEPDGSIWSAGERRLRVMMPLCKVEYTTRTLTDAAARELGIGRA
ncbi:hypothetical protein [Dankookia sp. P2]|uniref:hypothetical protein n=1 Tax=Dankookia sp. P2 TaxID=3423955 RepID=UPI003D677FAE